MNAVGLYPAFDMIYFGGKYAKTWAFIAHYYSNAFKPMARFNTIVKIYPTSYPSGVDSYYQSVEALAFENGGPFFYAYVKSTAFYSNLIYSEEYWVLRIDL